MKIKVGKEVVEIFFGNIDKCTVNYKYYIYLIFN